MILFDDNYARIFKQMSEERTTIEYWMLKNSKKVQRDFRFSPKVPVWHHDIRTIPTTHNNYLIYYYAMNRAECLDGTCFLGNVLLLDDNKGRPLAIQLKRFSEPDTERKHTFESLQIYTGHFFSRYRERYKYLKDLNRYDLLTSFFGRNGGYLCQVDYKKVTLEKDRINEGAAFAIDDGVTLAKQEWLDVENNKILIVKHNTFLSRTELKSDQTENFPSQAHMRARLMHHYKDT